MDDERFRALYEQSSRDILAYLLRRAPTPEDAADCLAETFAIAWDKRDRIPEDARPWLFGVARNLLRRGFERDLQTQATTAAMARDIRGLEVMAPVDDAPLTAALDQLSELDREIITLGAWDGLSPREIAKVLGLSANVVRVRAHRARAKLRSLLAAEEALADKAAERSAL